MTASSDTFREMVATAIIIKPGKSTRSHQRDIVACDTSGSGGDSGGDGTTAVEEDCILLTWKKDRKSDATEVRAEQRAQKIADRLTRIAEKLERSGKADRLTLIQQRADDREAKAAVRAQHKLERDQARAEGGKGGGDDKGKPIDNGRPDGKGKPDGKGGGQGGGGQGGGKK